MKKLWKFGWLGVGFLAAWLAGADSPPSRSPHEDWREAQRKAEAEKRRIQDAFDPQYNAAWRELNARMTRYHFADYSGIFLMFAAGFAFSGWDEKGILRVLPMFLLLGVLLYGRSHFGNRVNEFRCPRCGKPFIHIDPQVRNPFGKLNKNGRRNTRCQNCELPLWAYSANDTTWRSFAEHQEPTTGKES